MSIGNVLALFGILFFIIIMKVLICSCFFRRRLQRRRNDDTLPILGDATERLREIHQQRIRSRRAREPPPTFEDALTSSRPVSYIDVEEPPPTYEEYLNANFKDDFVEYSPSVNPSDIIIPLDTHFSQIDLEGESNA